MKLFKNFFPGLTLLLLSTFFQGCNFIDAVIAQGEGELSFEVKDNWDYAAKVMPPELIEQIRRENINETWIGDPRRFQAIQVQQFGQKSPLYFVDPYIPCPEKGCATQQLYDEYHPLCTTFGGCQKLVYLEQENGTYRRVFQALFFQQASENEGFLKVSNQLYQGLPACFSLVGFDDERRREGRTEEGEFFVTKYCYNGTDYVFQEMYVVQRQQN
jgi:hypothetical protein